MVKPSEVKPISGKKGNCLLCSGPATVNAIYEVEGVTVVQRYCDACLPNAEL